MAGAIQFVLDVISSAVSWLASWEYLGVPFLYFFIGVAIISIVMRFML